MSPSLQITQTGGFAREVKFVIDPSLAVEIRKWARTWLSPDPHGDTYQISSLYFDTESYDVLNRNGSFARGKYRIRRYGSSETIFLERKLKTGGRVGKKRTHVELRDLPRIAQPEPDPEWSGYWYHRRILVRRLQPVCQISYTRMARVGSTPKGTIRLTLDDDITVLPAGAFAFDSTRDPLRVPTEGVVLELKYRDKPPLFQQLIERFKLVPQPASKYRAACAALGLGIPEHA